MHENRQSGRDFKSLSFDLYNKPVIIIPKEGTETRNKSGKEIRGRLTGRIWGSKITNNISEETVVALQILDGEDEIIVPCEDVEILKEDEYPEFP